MTQDRTTESTQNPTPAGSTQPDDERKRGPRPDSPAPGGNRLNDIAEEDIDKVVPRNPQETELHDHARGGTDERDRPDETGEIPRPL